MRNPTEMELPRFKQFCRAAENCERDAKTASPAPPRKTKETRLGECRGNHSSSLAKR